MEDSPPAWVMTRESFILGALCTIYRQLDEGESFLSSSLYCLYDLLEDLLEPFKF